MTARELYDYGLTELNKNEAPSLLLEDYNYFINKAIQQYINLVYAKLEIDQQSTDDIRVLKASSALTPIKMLAPTADGPFESTYYVDLPADYLHLLNCVIEYNVNKTNKCYDEGKTVLFSARRLTPDMYSQIVNNAYMCPSYKRPYYYLNNVNTSTSLPTNKKQDDEVLLANGLETATTSQKAAYYRALEVHEIAEAAYKVAEFNYRNNSTEETKAAYDEAIANLKIATENLKTAADDIRGNVPAVIPSSSLVDAYNEAGDRLANPSTVRMELRFGKDDRVFTPKTVYVDYVKAPMYIRLTEEQINSSLDYSQVLEFPDYVCFEIVNIFVRLVMENASDPRLQTNMPLNSTIATSPQVAAQQAES